MNFRNTALWANRFGPLAIMLAAMLWGTVGVARQAIYHLTPEANALSIGFFRLAFASPALILTAWQAVGPNALGDLRRIARRDLALMLVMGAAMALYQVCYFAAIPYLGVMMAVLIAICTAPVMVALMAAFLLGERFTVRVGAALIGAIVGVILLVVSPAQSSAGGIELIGALLALGAALSYAALTLCSRALANRYHPLQPIAVAFTAGAVMLLPFTFAAGLVITFPPAGWLLLIHLGLVPTALGYWLFLYGMKHTTATIASILTLMEPLTSTVLAALFFGEWLGPWGYVGAGLLLGMMGLLITSRQPTDNSRQTMPVGE